MSDRGVRLHTLEAKSPVHDSPPLSFKEPRPADLESVSSETSLSFVGGLDDAGIRFGLTDDEDPPGFPVKLHEILKVNDVLQLIKDHVGSDAVRNLRKRLFSPKQLHWG